jgi:hypothetical protein
MTGMPRFAPETPKSYVSIAERCRRVHKEALRPGGNTDGQCFYERSPAPPAAV